MIHVAHYAGWPVGHRGESILRQVLKEEDEGKVRDLIGQMGDAESSRDDTFFQTLLADNFTFHRANGDVVDKTTFLKDLLDPANIYKSPVVQEDISVQVYEGVAVATLLVRAEGTRQGKEFAGVYRNIRIFVHEPNRRTQWQLHTWFNVKVPKEQK